MSQGDIYLYLHEHGEATADELTEATGLPFEEVCRALCEMTLQGEVWFREQGLERVYYLEGG
jgi:predicted Rossmann fold nucleotide-binding protein DprA/Smf involved in DNA uptake